jgi:hypothetical protein
MRIGDARVLSLMAFALFGDPAAAQEGVGMKLEDAGFVMREANTPEKMARLRQLPAHRFVTRTGATGRYYIYADPTYCKCAFVGTPAAMQAYRNMVSPPPMNLPGISSSAPSAPSASGGTLEDQMIREMDSDMGPVPEGDLLDFRF